MIEPDGNFLLVANQDSDNVVVFKRNKTTGLLKATGQEIKVPKPVCLKMIGSN
jgi:6-phosphogluconolactonase